MLVCPNKKSKEWILLEKQLGEDKAYTTWAHYNFDFPASIRNTSTLKKNLSFKEEITTLQRALLSKRIAKYNRKNGTSHSYNPLGYNYNTGTFNIELIINYLPVSKSTQIVKDNNGLFSKEEEKALMNISPESFVNKEDIPDLFIQSGNQFFKDGEVYATYEDAVGEDAMPDDIVGDKKNLKPKFQEVADLYSAKVQLLRKTIGRLTEQKKDAAFEEKLRIETRINGLKQSIQTLIGDKNDAAVKGKIDNILKLNAIEDIEPFANEQLSEVEKIFTQDNISEEELEYARKVVSTWITAGDFSGKDTLFFDEDELESIDDDLLDIKNKFIGWKNRAERIQRKFIIPLEVNKVAEGINNTFNTNITDFETVVEDVTGLKAATLDISEVNHPILQAMMGWVKIANYHAHMEADEVSKKLDELLDKVSNLDWDLFQQRFSNTDSRKTGNLTFRFSQQYYDAVSNVFDEANAIKNNPQLRNRKFNEAIEFLRKNTIIFDVRKLFPDEEVWGSKYTAEENEIHVRKLKETLGEIGYEEFYKKAEEKVEEYKLDKEAYLTHLEATEDSSAQIAAEMDAWEKNNSPAYEANIIEVGGTKEKVAGKFVNPTGKYSVKIPQRMISGKDTGYYDSNFAKIEADENTRNLYNHIFRTLNDLKQYLPYDETKWMHINSLPTIPLTILEEFGKDKLHKGLSPVWDELKRATTISDVSTESKKSVNLVTGEPDKELQTQYLIDYNEQIEKQLQLAVIQFVQDNGRNPNVEEYINLKRDISDKIAKEKTFDLGKVTKAYTHMALTYKHKSAIQDVMKAGEAIVKRQIEQMQTNSGEPKTRFQNPLGKKGGLDNINNMLDTFMTMYWGYGNDKPFGKGGKVYTSKELELKKQLESIKEQNEQDLKDGTITDREYEAIEALVTDQLEVLGGIRAYSKYGDMILKYIQLKGMGWNVFAGLTNMTFGFVANLIEASDGRNYTNQDFWKAQAAVLNTIGGYNRFSEKGKKISALMSKLDVLKTSKNELYKSTKLGLSKKLDKVGKVVNPYTPQASTEYINQAVVMMAMMYNTKVIVDGVETNLFEAYDNNGNLKEGVEFVNKEYNTDLFKVRLDKIIKMNHGNYDPDAPLSIKRHMWGRALVQFKTWALQGFAERFMDELPDIQLGITRKGRYRSYASYYKTMQENGTGWIPATFNITKQLLRKAAFGKYNTQFDEIQGLSEVDAANMRKNMTEIMTLISITVLTLLIKAAFVDDDDKDLKYIAYFWINQLNRLNTDMSFYTSPLAFEKLQQNTIPAFSLVTDTQKALIASWNLISGGQDILKQGPNKGQSKAARAINRVIPSPISAFQRLQSSGESIFADKPIR